MHESRARIEAEAEEPHRPCRRLEGRGISKRRPRPSDFALARCRGGAERRAAGSSSGTTRRGPYEPLTCWTYAHGIRASMSRARWPLAIPRSCAPVAGERDGARRTTGSISATAGARKATTARRRHGTASPGRCGAASTTCVSGALVRSASLPSTSRASARAASSTDQLNLSACRSALSKETGASSHARCR